MTSNQLPGVSVSQFATSTSPLAEIPEVRLVLGKVYVGPIYKTKNGKDFRHVTVAYRDTEGRSCKVDKFFNERNLAEADPFIDYQEADAPVLVSEINPEPKIYEGKEYRGERQITYTYEVKNMVLWFPQAVTPEGYQNAVASIPEQPQDDHSLQPWELDASVPFSFDEPTLPQEATMSPEQLDGERIAYHTDVLQQIPGIYERLAFFQECGVSPDPNQWLEDTCLILGDMLEKWFQPPTTLNGVCHETWIKQSIQAGQVQDFLKTMRRFPEQAIGKTFLEMVRDSMDTSYGVKGCSIMQMNAGQADAVLLIFIEQANRRLGVAK